MHSDHVRLAFARLRRLAEESLPPGASITITDRDGPVFRAATGVVDVLTDEPTDTRSKFQIGSISKTVTAAALLRLADSGEVDLHAPVSRHLDWFVLPNRQPVTIHHLLTHTGGVVGFIDTLPASRLVAWLLRDTPLVAAPGERFHYSNMGYLVLGYVVEEVTGTSLSLALDDLVFGPLGMADSSGAVDPGDARLATGHVWSDRRSRHAPLERAAFKGAHGSVTCSAPDLAALLRMLLSRGRFGGNRFLREESVAAMFASQAVTDDPDYGYGYGLFVGRPRSRRGHHIIQHGGENPGFEAVMIGDLDDGRGVVVLVNSYASPWPVAGYALDLLRALASDEPTPAAPRAGPTDKPSVSGEDPAPDHLAPFVGAYRAHAPLLSDYRVLYRGHRLALEVNGLFEVPLTQVDEATFLTAEGEPVEFDVLVGGEAQRATIGGGVYARVESA